MKLRLNSSIATASLALVLLGIAAPVAAQPTFAESVASRTDGNDIDLNLNAGVMLAYGNARTLGLNVAGAFLLRQDMEQFVAEINFLYGTAASPLTCGFVQAAPGAFPPDTVAFCGDPTAGGMDPGARAPGFSDWRENASNLNWRLRFDHFFDADNAFFVAHRGRIDYFAGLDLRLAIQAGYSRMLFREENHTLALDVGVDMTVDIYSESVRAQNRDLVAAGTSLPNFAWIEGRAVPALRLQLAYVNHINAVLTYDTTFEVLWDIPNPDHFRFEWINHIRSAIDTWLQISLDVTFRLDSLPPGQARAWNEITARQTTTMFDMIATLNLVGAFDLDGEPPPPPEVPDCPAPTPCPDCTTLCEGGCTPVSSPPVDVPPEAMPVVETMPPMDAPPAIVEPTPEPEPADE